MHCPSRSANSRPRWSSEDTPAFALSPSSLSTFIIPLSLPSIIQAYTLPWYATTAARTFGLAGLLKFFIFNTAGASFPALMLTSGKFVPVGTAQAAVSLVGGALLAVLGARLDASGVVSRAGKGAMTAFLVGCVAVAAIAAHFTPVDPELTARFAGWPKEGSGVASVAREGRPVPPPAPLAAPDRDAIPDPTMPSPMARRSAADSDAAFFGSGKEGGRS